MLVISERINGLFRDVERAIAKQDANAIQKLALEHAKVADMLDVNTGAGVENAPKVMEWLVTTIQDVTDKPLAIDTTNLDVMEAGLKAAKSTAMINSTTAEEAKMEKLFPVAKEYNAEIVCLTLDERGIPNNANSRAELAMRLVAKAMEHQVPTHKLYLDPVILPVGAAQDQPVHILETFRLFRTLCEPAQKQ